jgi:Lrp/AsnC family leucine-responsive transcriptional regulator
MMTCKVDEIDLKIIKSLSEDCRKSTTQIAKEAGISRPTAIARIRSLAEKEIVDFGAKVRIANIGFKMASLTLEADTAEAKQKNVEIMKTCPRVMQLVQTVEKPHYSALVCAEDSDTLLSAIECLRTVLNARITSWQRAKPIIGDTFDLRIFLEKCELTPCGKKCGLCSSYQESECAGCPPTRDYRGPLLATKPKSSSRTPM